MNRYTWIVLLYSLILPNTYSNTPVLCAETFQNLAQHGVLAATTLYCNPLLVKKGDIIFVKTEMLEYFFTIIHPAIANAYILITHFSDESCPGIFAPYLDDPKLIHWYGIQPDIIHSKFTALPVGLGYSVYSFERFNCIHSENSTKPPKKNLLLLNFGIDVYPSVRQPTYDFFSCKAFCTVQASQPFNDYMHSLTESKFMVSPRGIGIDCFKTWEALSVGCIPVVISSVADQLYQDLPVLIVASWEEVTEEFLELQYNKMTATTYHLDRLSPIYWDNVIKQHQAKSR